MKKRLAKKSNTVLALMIIAIVAIIALLLLWNPTPATAKVQLTQNEQSEEDIIAQTTLVKEGEAAPTFTINMVDGTKINIADLKGKTILVNFWATWCGPCRAELKRVQAEIIDKFANKNFIFIPINRGENREKVVAFLNANSYKFNVGLDPDQSVYKLFASNYIPRNFLINSEGKVVYIGVGYDEKEFAELVATITKTIK